jgi:hypothetical protein
VDNTKRHAVVLGSVHSEDQRRCPECRAGDCFRPPGSVARNHAQASAVIENFIPTRLGLTYFEAVFHRQKPKLLEARFQMTPRCMNHRGPSGGKVFNHETKLRYCDTRSNVSPTRSWTGAILLSELRSCSEFSDACCPV